MQDHQQTSDIVFVRGRCYTDLSDSVYIQTPSAAGRPEVCTVGAVFPGLPGYRPRGREARRTTGPGTHPLARKSVPYGGRLNRYPTATFSVIRSIFKRRFGLIGPTEVTASINNSQFLFSEQRTMSGIASWTEIENPSCSSFYACLNKSFFSVSPGYDTLLFGQMQAESC